MEEFKYLTQMRVQQNIDSGIGAVSAVVRMLYCSVVVKRELVDMVDLHNYPGYKL